MRSIFRLLRLALIVGVSGALFAATCLLIAPYAYRIANANSAVDEEIDLRLLDDFAVRSYIYAADGSLLANLHGPENRSPVTLDKVPGPVKDTIIAVEDSDFYTHPGVNLRATFRALMENVSSGGINQGGSTITQQLIKNALTDDKQDLNRKSREAALAVRLERRLTKDQILEHYLNTVYFGSGAYGVQAAAEIYFCKNVGELDWGQAAMLASLINNPVRNDPTLYPERAQKQRQLALDRLVTLGKITPAEAEKFGRTPVPTVRYGTEAASASGSKCNTVPQPAKQDYFTETVRRQLLENPYFGLGATKEERERVLYGGGLKVKTTLFPIAQTLAYAAREEVLPHINLLTAAMVSVEPSSGAVRAMVGGPGFDFYEYNIAAEPPGRQPGSSMKVFTLLTALEQGAVPGDTFEGGGDFPNIGGSPNPYNMPGPGGSLTSMTTVSSNGGFMRVSMIDGLANVVAMARKLGVAEDLGGPSNEPFWKWSPINLTLGTKEITPLEMASAYSAIPNGGKYTPWYTIESIEDRNGRVIYQHKPTGTQAVNPQTACLATQILSDNVKYGTGKNATLPKQPAAGKTGTTNDHADTWFVGYTPYLATAVWVGDVTPGPDGQPRRNPVRTIAGRENFGGEFPARIWGAYNEKYHQNLPVLNFPTCFPTRAPRFIRSGWDYLLPEGQQQIIPFPSLPGTPPAAPPRKPTTPTTKPPTTPTTEKGPPLTPVPPPTAAPPPSTAAPPTTAGP